MLSKQPHNKPTFRFETLLMQSLEHAQDVYSIQATLNQFSQMIDPALSINSSKSKQQLSQDSIIEFHNLASLKFCSLAQKACDNITQRTRTRGENNHASEERVIPKSTVEQSLAKLHEHPIANYINLGYHLAYLSESSVIKWESDQKVQKSTEALCSIYVETRQTIAANVQESYEKDYNMPLINLYRLCNAYHDAPKLQSESPYNFLGLNTTQSDPNLFEPVAKSDPKKRMIPTRSLVLEQLRKQLVSLINRCLNPPTQSEPNPTLLQLEHIDILLTNFLKRQDHKLLEAALPSISELRSRAIPAVLQHLPEDLKDYLTQLDMDPYKPSSLESFVEVTPSLSAHHSKTHQVYFDTTSKSSATNTANPPEIQDENKRSPNTPDKDN